VSIVAVKNKKAKRKIPLYFEEERDGLREAGRFNAQLMDFVRQHVVPGANTLDLDRLIYEYTTDHGHAPATLGYKGYPRSTCTSVNEVVCHGIPDTTRLQDGDIVNVDLTTVVDGWYGDSSETFIIGRAQDDVRRLVQVAFDSLHAGIQACQPFARVCDIGRTIERYAKARGYEVVREYQGHGIGREFHQEPGVPHYLPKVGACQDILEPGMCFTVEPMVNAGTWRTFVDTRDNWTVRTLDLALSAQFEHTVLITESGPEILTQPIRGPHPGQQF